MSDTSDSQMKLNRRTLLRNFGVAAVASASTAQTVSASSTQSWDQTFEPRVVKADIADKPEVKTAKIKIHENGSVSKTLALDRDKVTSGSESKKTTYSLNLTPKSESVSAQSTQSSSITPADLTAEIEKPAESDGQASTSGLDEPSAGGYDAVYYGQTESQECGPLARTIVKDDNGSDWDHDRESVDGEACEGETWDEKFEPFCEVQKRFTGNCEVPDAFNTEWNNQGDFEDGDTAGTIWDCPDFPAVSGTVVTAHNVEASGSDVNFNAAHGVAPGINWSEYDLDQNGIANAANDLGNLLTGGILAPFSWAVSTWLLEDNANTLG
ncbi:hypothetical protein AMS69_12235 [Haloarcula rubripromontorii]|uniref:Uncharacterized protein n=1 Tax=Haloarcula rubripromontorii TaxID=1705562 RepID=A0A0M9AKB1_9EURY|nr:hypothetical protein [Haloarcula rubripromontorii]KOX93198.1 hypothetical protein AMS69_12235 [Haloarcula rubripromontorii]